MSCARTRRSVGPLRWTWQSTCSTACWSWDARTTSAWPNPGPGWGHCARIPDPCNTASRDPLGEKSRGLAQDQVLVLEPLHLALEAQHLGFIRLLLGQGLGRARRKLLIAPLAELARADIQLRRNVSQRPPALHHTLNRLGLVLARKPSPRSFVCHSILLGCLGSLQNPPLHRGKPTPMPSPCGLRQATGTPQRRSWLPRTSRAR